MLTPVHCIALRTVRLSDSRNLLSAWSREAGRITFAIPAGATREARRRKAMTSPLAFFEGIADIRDNRDIQTVRD
ncbi:MAG: recombination protein O N-terminal domain-containing protein, partial [Muribaculaceae bacterium]|nr:recombination protein O N-terminal domain-containing protein [Muribaculaceae bacterium]